MAFFEWSFTGLDASSEPVQLAVDVYSHEYGDPTSETEEEEENEENEGNNDFATGQVAEGESEETVADGAAAPPSWGHKKGIRETAFTLGAQTRFSTWQDLLLSFIADGPRKSELVAFIEADRLAQSMCDTSLVPVEAFTCKQGRTDWDTHCPLVMSKLRDFVAEIDTISNGQIRTAEIAAPSGPMRARGTFLWHYPTFKSPHSVYGHVMDPESPSLRIQQIKIGLPRDVRTQDMIPIRLQYPPKGDGVPYGDDKIANWAEIRQACFNFNWSLLRQDRFIIVVGQKTLDCAKDLIISKGFTWSGLELNTSVRLFSDIPRLYLALDSLGSICKVIIPVFHGQFVFYNKDTKVGALWDLLWNVGCEFAGIGVQNFTYFQWKASRATGSAHSWGAEELDSCVGLVSERHVLSAVMKKEKDEKRLLSPAEVEGYFPELLKREAHLREEMDTAVARGWTASSVIERFFVHFDIATKKKRAAEKRAAEDPAPAPPPKVWKATDGQKKWLESDAARESRARGNQEMSRRASAKLLAFNRCFQVVQSLAARNQPDCTPEEARAIRRIDTINELAELSKTDRSQAKKLSNELSAWVIFYDPKKTTQGLKYLPEQGVDEYALLEHPAVAIMRAWRWTKEERAMFA